jgi:hypothetical protein
VPARVGVYLRAIQGHGAKLEHSHRTRKLQHLDEQGAELRHKALAKGRDRIVIGMLVARDVAKRHRVVRRAFNRPAREHLGRIPVHQQPQQHRRVIRRRARSAISFDEFRQIQSVDHFHHEARQMSLRQPLIHRGRQQKSSVAIDRSKVVHGYRQS